MQNKKKATILYNAIWTLVVCGILAILYLAIQKKANAELSEVKIMVKPIKGNRNLIHDKEIRKMFQIEYGYPIEQSVIKELDLRALETMLENDRRVNEAEVYVDNKNRLFIAIAQREPIVRIISKDQSYYLDQNGKVIPTVSHSTLRVPVATGNIELYDEKLIGLGNRNHLNEVYELANYIYKDEFLNALIEQIDVDESGSITLVPKIGRQKLVFGNSEDIDERFDKMKLFYKAGLPKLGWRKHSVLRLDLEGQIVGELRTKN